MTLNKQTAAFLEAVNGSQPFDLSSASAQEVREVVSKLLPPPAPPEGTAHLQVLQKHIPTRNSSIEVRIYSPPSGQSLPLTIFFHGGGFCLGGLDDSDSICRLLAIRSGGIIVSVDYRLAPEAPYPAAVEDAQDSLLWIEENAADFGGDPNRIAVAGNSAGGNLAAVLAQWAHDSHIQLRHQLLLFPVTDASHEAKSYGEFGDGYFLTAEMMRWFFRNYIPDLTWAYDPQISPLLHPDPSGVAPTTIFTAEYDPLRDEGEAFGVKLANHGVPVAVKRWNGQIHDFTRMAGLSAEADQAVTEAGEALHRALHR